MLPEEWLPTDGRLPMLLPAERLSELLDELLLELPNEREGLLLDPKLPLLPLRPLPMLRLLSRPMLLLPEPNERLSF